MSGLDKIPLRIPQQWSAAWFERFCREVLALADARNAIAGLGISIDGTPDAPATISSSTDVENLTEASLITVLSSNLDNARQLTVEPGVLELDDNGGGSTVALSLKTNGVPLGKLQEVTPYAVLGDRFGGVGQIVAGSNDVVLARTGDALDFVQLTVDMAPDGTWTNVKLANMAQDTIKGRATASTGAPEDLTASQVKTILAIEWGDLGGTPEIPGGLDEYADDAAAAVGGVAVDGLYRTASVVKIRVS